MALIGRALSIFESHCGGVRRRVDTASCTPLKGRFLPFSHLRNHLQQLCLAGLIGVGLGTGSRLPNKNIILKEACTWFLALGLEHSWLRSGRSTSAVGQTTTPLALVGAFVSPSHFALAFSHVLAEFTTIDITIGPFELSPAVFAICTIVSLVLVATLAYPVSFSLANSLLELSGIGCTWSPVIFPMTMWFAGFIMATVSITVSERLYPVALFDKLTECACIKQSIPW